MTKHSRPVALSARDHADALDLAWFAAHPGKLTRTREYICGEFEFDSGGICGGMCGQCEEGPAECWVPAEYFVSAYAEGYRELVPRTIDPFLVAEMNGLADQILAATGLFQTSLAEMGDTGA